MRISAPVGLFVLALLAAPLRAQWTPERPDSRGPIGLAPDGVLAGGAWSFDYDFRHQSSEGLSDGGDDLNDPRVLRRYAAVPTRMRDQTHTFGLQYGAAEWLSLRAELPFHSRHMTNRARGGGRFDYRSEGMGDARLWALPVLHQGRSSQLLADAGVSLPTGSVEQTGANPIGAGARLPYPMQLGSGTVDLLPGLTWKWQGERLSCGAQALGTIRLDENDEDYALGNRGELSLWGAWRLAERASISLRLAGQVWEDVDGRDPALAPRSQPTADPDAQGGQRIDVLAGIQYYLQEGLIGPNRLAVEVGVPVWQDLNGPQLETGWLFQAGIEILFGGAGNRRVM